jgi:hypothetical protein
LGGKRAPFTKLPRSLLLRYPRKETRPEAASQSQDLAVPQIERLGERVRVNVNPGSTWNFSTAGAFLIVNVMRSILMTYDVNFADWRRLESENYLPFRQNDNAPMAVASNEHKPTGTQMIIGAWYLDEFGNPTREIRARD